MGKGSFLLNTLVVNGCGNEKFIKIAKYLGMVVFGLIVAKFIDYFLIRHFQY